MTETNATITSRIRRHLAVLASVLLLVALPAVGIASATPASASLLDLTCVASFQITFQPALRPGATAAAGATAEVDDCVSLNGAYPALRTATAVALGTTTATQGLDPCGLVFTLNADVTIGWDTGQTSTLTATLSTDLLTGKIGISGMVTAGPLTGDHIVLAIPVVALPNLDCLFAGLTTLSAPVAVLTFG